MSKKRRWTDCSVKTRTALALLGMMQITLALSAWRDLAQRPPSMVRGRKAAWAGIIAINTVGPLVYFRFGRLKMNK